MSGFAIEQLVFDPTAVDDTHSVGAFVRAGSDGALITHTADGGKERLDVNIGVEYAEGTAFAGGERGAFMLAVNESGNYAPLRVNDDGELLVDVTVTTGADKAEDSAHASGDIGSYVLAVRQDTLANSVSADGDYGSFKLNSVGALWVQNYKNAPASGHNAADEAVTNVTDAATPVPAAALANRTKIVLQNRSKTVPVTIGFSNAITFGAGPNLSPGSSVELEIAANVTLHAIADTGKNADLASYELAFNP
jgi:hypothetical protein